MKSYIYLIMFIFTFLVSCTNGDSDPGNQNAPKPPVEDPDKIKYAENLLDFSTVPLKQYLVQSQNNEVYVDNQFDVFLNLGAAQGLEPEKYSKISFDVNMTVELNSKDLTSAILSNSICKLTYTGSHSCTIKFKPIKDIGVYTLKFSYKGININKQILLYVATRTGWFSDNTKEDLHILGVNYDVDLVLKSNLPADDLKLPLTYQEDTICIKKIGDRSAQDQGTECIQNPKCEYSPQSGELPRTCNITYQLLKGGDNHPIIQVNTSKLYLRKLEVANYQPLTCIKEGLELIKSKENPKSIDRTIYLDSKTKDPQFFTAYYCAFNQTSEAKKNLKFDVSNIEPNNGKFKDALKFTFTDEKSGKIQDFAAGETVSINNGSYNLIHVKYNTEYHNSNELDMFGSAQVDFSLTDIGSHSIGKSGFTLINPSRIKYLKMNTVAALIDAEDEKEMVFKSHNPENNKQLFIKPHNLNYPGNSTLIMKTCFVKPESGISNPKYEAGGSDTNACLIGYDYLDANRKKQTATLDDMNITVGYYAGEKFVKLPRWATPTVVNNEDLLKLKNGEIYTLYIDATEVYPDLKSHIQVKFYEQDTDNIYRAAEHFTGGDLDISLQPQKYLVEPGPEKNLSAFNGTAIDHIDKFYMRVKPGTDSAFKSHKIRLKIDKSSSIITSSLLTVKAYHMEKEESLDDPSVMADNCVGDSCSNKCTLSDKGDVTGKFCECTIPDDGGITPDAKACNFEIVSYGQKGGDSIKLVLVDEKDRTISDQTILVRYKDGSNDINMTFDKYAPKFNLLNGKDIKNAVLFPFDQVTHVVKKGGDWDEKIFKPEAFFNSKFNLIVQEGILRIINFPGRVNYSSSTNTFSIGKFSLWTNSGKMSNQDLESLTCDVSAGSINIDHENFNGSESAYTRFVVNHVTDSITEPNTNPVEYHNYKDYPHIIPANVSHDAGYDLIEKGTSSAGTWSSAMISALKSVFHAEHRHYLYSEADEDYKGLWTVFNAKYIPMQLESSVVSCQGIKASDHNKTSNLTFNLVQNNDASITSPICISGLEANGGNKIVDDQEYKPCKK